MTHSHLLLLQQALLTAADPDAIGMGSYVTVGAVLAVVGSVWSLAQSMATTSRTTADMAAHLKKHEDDAKVEAAIKADALKTANAEAKALALDLAAMRDRLTKAEGAHAANDAALNRVFSTLERIEEKLDKFFHAGDRK